MKKFLIGFAIIVLALIGVAVFRGEAIVLSYVGGQTDKRSFDELSALLVPAMQLRLPDAGVAGPGPYPLFVQMHGCGGLSLEQHGSYAEIANAEGYAALIVSSNAPRGYDFQRSLSEICAGKTLLGQERAGDIMVALNLALGRDDIDAERVVLGGWSHGAWTVMDYLSFNRKTGVPTSLVGYDGPRPAIKAAVLFYPYCGIGSRTRVHGWDQQPEVLALMGDADTVVDYEACQKAFDQLERRDATIDRHVYAGADHAFDNAGLRGDVAHWYNAEYSVDARARVAAFLKQAAR